MSAMKKSNSVLVSLLQFLIFIARIIISVTVIWVGYTLITGELYISQTISGGFGTGLFLLIIGAYFFFSAFLRHFFDQ